MELTNEAKATFERLFGSQPQPDKRDPELLAILQNQIFGEVFSTGVVDDKMRELITVTSIASMGQLPQLKAHTAPRPSTWVTARSRYAKLSTPARRIWDGPERSTPLPPWTMRSRRRA